MCVFGEEGHQTCVLCPMPGGMDVPCSYPSQIFAEVKGGFSPLQRSQACS